MNSMECYQKFDVDTYYKIIEALAISYFTASLVLYNVHYHDYARLMLLNIS